MNRFFHQIVQKVMHRENEAWIRRIKKETDENERVLHMPLERLFITAIDSETTGFIPESGNEIMSIAAVHWQGEILPDPFHSYVRIEGGIPQSITELTGIGPEDVADAPPIKEVLPAFFDHVGSSVLIGYYIGHDVRFINYFLWKNFRTRIHHRVLEVGKVVELLYPELRKASFDEVCAFFGIAIAGRHTAIGDAFAVAELWGKLVITLQEKGIHHLLALYEHLVKQRPL